MSGNHRVQEVCQLLRDFTKELTPLSTRLCTTLPSTSGGTSNPSRLEDTTEATTMIAAASIQRLMIEAAPRIADTLGSLLPDADSTRTALWAPCFCTPLANTPTANLDIFGFRRRGERIPLHDHPQMYGFMRAIRGRVRVESFSWLEAETETSLFRSSARNNTANEAGIRIGHEDSRNKPTALMRPARYEGSRVLLSSSAAANMDTDGDGGVGALTPLRNNIHSVEAFDNGAVFFDVLVPGYDKGGRRCHYYALAAAAAKEDESESKQKKPLPSPLIAGEIYWLKQVPESADGPMQSWSLFANHELKEE